MGQKILILGATSAIAEAVARAYCRQADPPVFALAARDQGKLDTVARDLTVRGAVVHTRVTDLADFRTAEAIALWAREKLQTIEVVLIAYGALGDHRLACLAPSAVADLININFTSAACHLTAIARIMESQRSGVIATLSSVAGDRGRQSNYIYGSAKGALTLFMQGVRNRLYSSGVRVVTLKLGFVDSPMTTDFKKGPLWATPTGVAPAIVHALARANRDLYIPRFWGFVMAIIKAIPEKIFVRLKL